MSQLFSRTKPTKPDDTIQRTKEKVIDVNRNIPDRQRHLKQLIGRKFVNESYQMNLFSILFCLEQVSVDELQAFFKTSYQYIFQLFFEHFNQVDSNSTRSCMLNLFPSLKRETNLFDDFYFLVSKQSQVELEYATGLLEVKTIGINHYSI